MESFSGFGQAETHNPSPLDHTGTLPWQLYGPA